MGKARAIACTAVLSALVACTYDVPPLASARDGGGPPGDGSYAAAPDGASSSGGDASAAGDSAGSSGASGSSSSSGGSSSSGSTSSSGAGDGGAADGPCSGPLCACSADTDCSTRICARELTVGSSLYAAAGSRDFCAQSCCTSADCDAGTVCFGSGQGGNYCVPPAWLGRSSPGGAIGGTSCTTGTQCRSGLCAGGRCADTCCSYADSAQECETPTKCEFGVFPGASFDTHFTAHCAASLGVNTYGEACTAGDDCVGGLCAGSGGGAGCSMACRSSADCPGAACLLYGQGNDIFAACFPASGGEQQGTSCSSDSQCASSWCGATSQCTNVCFTDAECITAWHCAPQSDVLPTGTYEVLACGP